MPKVYGADGGQREVAGPGAFCVASDQLLIGFYVQQRNALPANAVERRRALDKEILALLPVQPRVLRVDA